MNKKYVKHCQRWCASIWIVLFGVAVISGQFLPGFNWTYTIVAPTAYAGIMYVCLILHHKYNLSGLYP